MPKTPEWAAAITGMPAETIRAARDRVRHAPSPPRSSAATRPGRTAYGEQFHRAAYALCRHDRQCRHPRRQLGHQQRRHRALRASSSLPAGTNPIDARVVLAAAGRSAGARQGGRLPGRHQDDLFGGAAISSTSAPTSNKIVAARSSGVEFMVVQDHFLTPTARYADIVLPATTFWERNDVHTPWAGAGHYAIFMKQAIEPMYECRNDIDIFADLAAPRSASTGYNDKTEERVAARADASDAIDDFETFARQGPRPAARARGRGGLRRARSATPSATRSRRRRARSRSTRWRWPPSPIPTASARIPPIPTWIRRSEPDPRYPLRLVHAQVARAHALDPRQPAGAGARRPRRRLDPPGRRAPRAASPTASACACSTTAARTVLPARVTDRIAPGVVSIKEGAWFTPDADGHGHARLRQRADRRPLVARGGDPVQLLLRGRRGGQLGRAR